MIPGKPIALIVWAVCICCCSTAFTGAQIKASNTGVCLLSRPGFIAFAFKGRQYRLNASLVPRANGKAFDITSGFYDNEDNILLVIPKVTAGTYAFGYNEYQSNLWIKNVLYQLNSGQITVTTDSRNLSGKFSAKIAEPDGKGGYTERLNSTINGTFGGLVIP